MFAGEIWSELSIDESFGMYVGGTTPQTYALSAAYARNKVILNHTRRSRSSYIR